MRALLRRLAASWRVGPDPVPDCPATWNGYRCVRPAGHPATALHRDTDALGRLLAAWGDRHRDDLPYAWTLERTGDPAAWPPTATAWRGIPGA